MERTQIQVAAVGAAGALAPRLATEVGAICARVNELINDLRADVYLAVRMDEFIKMVAGGLDAQVAADDVKKCIKYDSTVKIVEVGGVEVLWLWSGWKLHSLIDYVADMARRYCVILAEAERHEAATEVGP